MGWKLKKPEQKALQSLRDDAGAAYDEVVKAREAHGAKLQDARDTLQAAIESYNEAVEAAFEDLKGPLQDYADTLEPLQEKLQELADDYTGQWDEKSERWQESDAGEEAQEFVQKLEELANGFPAADIEAPDPLDVDTVVADHEVDLDALSEVLDSVDELLGEA